MQPGARVQAAIDVLHEIVGRGRAASVALADWGRAHRFAGSADRAWIGNLVYDGLRRKQSLSYLMQSDTPRAIALAALRHSWGFGDEDIAGLCTGERFSPEPLTEEERKGLEKTDLSGAPPWVQGDYPEWLHASFSAAFGEGVTGEGQALARRAPADLRVNTLKATREKVLKAFARYGATGTAYSPLGVRLPAREGGLRSPNVEADPAHGRGWFEVQDEGSQIAALLAGAGPRMQVADICAGAGGKTLAMAAQMQNTGQVYAYDADPIRFRPIFERLKRAGARNVQALPPGQDEALDALEGRMDLVLIDAPCSGTGVWRRRPDAKWRLTRAQLAERVAMQHMLLSRAAPLVKPGGTLAYVTCSMLPEENDRQIEAFLESNPGFIAINAIERAAKILSRPMQSGSSSKLGILLTPAQHETDGFYIALLSKGAA
ncbi:MAG: RsmB/NOP family class I SAM-dependent RNA methyltransferase [Rhodomicrobium sp.]|nr:RsmB/NOP family class I SAM-dependent RNA methyltransferase [Rhodomicrobium sp.]